MRNGTKVYTFFTTLLIFLNFSCKEGVNNGLEENPFKPWAYNEKLIKPINDSLTSEYMNSRFPRLVENFNRDWTFNYSPSGQEKDSLAKAGFDDSSWQAIAIPHTWQTFETTGDIHPYVKNASERDDPYWWKGWGYYRKHFEINQDLKNKKFFVEFDGVQKYSKVYLNGNFIGDHKGGYNSFSFDITNEVKLGEKNVLVVMVNNARRDKFNIPPMTAGNFNIYGGIYRDVRLVVKNDVYIPYQGDYRHHGGTFVTTPHISRDNATANVITYVRNDSKKEQNVTLSTTILDPNGDEVAKLESIEIIKPNSDFKFDQTTKSIANPKLWSPDSPSLYKVVSKVLVNGEIQDELQSPMGFRYFHWDYDNNDLYVNGKRIEINGINRHQEYPWLGDAIPHWLTEKDMYDIKFGLGFNFMRAGHYPNDPLVYDIADQLGIIMVEEVPNIKSIDFNEEVQEQNVREMIRRDRNHPSIFFWSMGNETSDAADSKWAVEEDTTRFIHQRKSERFGDFVNHNHTNLDMENLLRVTVHGWFTQDDAPKSIDVRPKNGQVASSESWQHQMAMKRGGSVRGVLNDNMVGWLYEDHGADREYKNTPVLHINPKGWVDNYRIPKLLYYLTQANYTEEPVLFIQPHYWRHQYLGQRKDLVLDSNCDEVQIFINDSLMNTVLPNQSEFKSVVLKDVLVQKGTLTAVGKKGGQEITTHLEIPGTPKKIVLESTHKELMADRSGLAVITAYLLDGSGNVVFDAQNTLKWEVSGPGKLVGYDVYESDMSKHEAMEGTGYMVAPVSNVVRTTNTPGTITVKVTSPGLEESSIEIFSKTPEQKDSPIEQPDLSDDGRKRVARIDNFAEKIDYKEVISKIRENKDFAKNPENEYTEQINGFIQKNSPEAKDYSKAYQLFVVQLNKYLIKMKGTLIADDFNFMAEQFNNYVMLYRAIEADNLHVDFTDILKHYYALAIIENNKQLDVADEMALLKKIPGNHLLLYIFDPTKKKPAGTVQDNYVRKSFEVWSGNPVEAIQLAFPSYKKLDSKDKKLVFEFIAQITPNVEYDAKREKFRFENKKMLVIPSPNVDDFLKTLK